MTRADPFDCFRYLASKVTNEIVVSGVGFHEWLSLTAGREANCPLGNMGTTIPIALGIAVNLPHKKVLCLTTDGDLLLRLSVLPPIGKEQPNNLVIIVNDNECYQTLHAGKSGYWPSMTRYNTDLAEVAKGCGISKAFTVRTVDDFAKEVGSCLKENELKFIVLKTEPSPFRGFRPDIDNLEYKYRFSRYIERSEGVNIFPKQKQDRSLVATKNT